MKTEKLKQILIDFRDSESEFPLDKTVERIQSLTPPTAPTVTEEPSMNELQPIVEKIAYSQQGEDQMGDLVAKMGMLRDFIMKWQHDRLTNKQ